MPKTKRHEEGTKIRFRVTEAGTGKHLGWIHRVSFESAFKDAKTIFSWAAVAVTQEA